MRRRRRGWSETSDVGKSGRGVIRDFSSHVDMPAYQDRTVAVERALLYRLVRRWAPMTIAIAAVLLGPFAGGWYYQQRTASRHAAESRARMARQLHTEVQALTAALRTQVGVLNSVEEGDLARAAELQAAGPTVAWRAASLQLDILENDASYAGIADFYARLAQVNRAMTRYVHAVDHARWDTGTSSVNAAAVAADAARLRTAIQATVAAGESAIRPIPAPTE